MIGLLFFIAVVALAGVGLLLFPLLIVLGWMLQLFFLLVLGIFAIWLLGKVILVLWEFIK